MVLSLCEWWNIISSYILQTTSPNDILHNSIFCFLLFYLCFYLGTVMLSAVKLNVVLTNTEAPLLLHESQKVKG
jgi:hypothetical protein